MKTFLALMLAIGGIPFLQGPMFPGPGKAALSPSVFQTCVGNNFNNTGVNNCTWSGSGNTNTGDVLILWVTGGTVITGWNTPTGCGVTWTLVANTTSANTQAIFSAPVVTGAACAPTTTVTGGTASALEQVVWDLQGVIATTDGTGFAQSFHALGTFNAPSVTTTVTGDLILTGGVGSSTGATLAINSPFTSDSAGVIGGAVYVSQAHYIQPASGIVTPVWTNAAGTFTTMTVAVEP
jgi:hypothetical protein